MLLTTYKRNEEMPCHLLFNILMEKIEGQAPKGIHQGCKIKVLGFDDDDDNNSGDIDLQGD